MTEQTPQPTVRPVFSVPREPLRVSHALRDIFAWVVQAVWTNALREITAPEEKTQVDPAQKATSALIPYYISRNPANQALFNRWRAKKTAKNVQRISTVQSRP